MEYIMNLLCSFVGTIAFCILFNVNKKYYMACGFTGLLGWACYLLSVGKLSTTLATFVSSIVVVGISRYFSSRMKCPMTVFLIAGIFPLIPGSSIYYTACHLAKNNFVMAARAGLEAAKIALAIVAGINFVALVPRNLFKRS